ncbi:MAG: Aspartyl/glutamyl-tRNA(Asn/Gln) amidotransferase subunit B [candidate division WS2 bacterium ADurb.Bin280]|uniref:Aspartyl/glutamyl-tRNA(Asn/Gln) amidotransferase subunit B n=1 Tax=candidate division WS2 bacterium ADurb.Bin280 TaxID=1852829 RepID=A0A1V5SC45_9BACT|nr:MAG: Aspartyl/glutamyl-tRNA(Asn/Gln) amidotransferase subunit B [candidate division WS2 bacterium ADurb.Bin280]
MNSDLKTTIGLEIHIQLKTNRKMFCFCSNKGEDESPNTFVCPICLAMPGTLPVPNIDAIEKIIKLGLSLNCQIPEKSKFDRKHYFYPDLPKGYQISQYDMPFCKGGYLEVDGKKIRLNRIHLEEDAGKLIHDGERSIVDLNRAGTPLAEMVSEPDIDSPSQAKHFMQSIQKLVRALDVSLANMEQGHMRCDANISVTNGTKRSPIVEIKNLNSFRFVEKALTIEQSRLQDEFDSYSGKEGKVTRGFDSKSGVTYQLRSKEEAKDYRYFPEPDIPPFDLTDKSFIDIERLKNEIPMLPEQKMAVLAEVVGDDLAKAILKIDHKDATLGILGDGSIDKKGKLMFGKLIVNNKEVLNLSREQMVDLAKVLGEKVFPSNILRNIISEAVKSGDLISSINIADDKSSLTEAVDSVIKNNPEAVKKYLAGKKETIGFLIGQVMRELQGKADPGEVKSSLENKIGG